MTTPAVTSEGVAPLTEAEARARAAAGRANTVVDQTSRPVSEIVRANVLTRFNALLGSLLIVILIVGPLQDALFGIILVLNTMVGIVQEVRAKRTLDRSGRHRRGHRDRGASRGRARGAVARRRRRRHRRGRPG